MSKRPPVKISGLVVAALTNLRDAHGSTAKEISKYITSQYNIPETTVQRQLKVVLKRGVEYGILKRTCNGYCLNAKSDFNQPDDDCEKPIKCPEKKNPVKTSGCKKKKKKKKPKRAACPKKKKKKKKGCKKKKKKKKKPKASCGKKKPKNPCKLCTICATREPRAEGHSTIFCEHNSFEGENGGGVRERQKLPFAQYDV